MRVLIDGDSFPNIEEIEKLCSKYNIELIVYIDTNHVLDLDYGKVNYVSSGDNAVDLVIENIVKKDDIVLTGDYGVAIICLSKYAHVLDRNGYFYTNDTIDYLVDLKEINRKTRKHSNIKGPKKRTKEDENRLLENISKIMEEYYEK